MSDHFRKQTSRVLKAFYTSPQFEQQQQSGSSGRQQPESWRWWNISFLPEVPASFYARQVEDDASFTNAMPRNASDRGDFASAAFYFVAGALGSSSRQDGWARNISASFAYFFSDDAENRDALTAGNLARSMVVCDFEAVTFCRKQQQGGPPRRNLVMSFLVAYAVFVIICTLVESIPVVGLALSPLWKGLALSIFVPGLAFQLAYGVGPACIPMVPTCLMEEILVHLQTMVPIKIVWPDSLQTSAGCIGNATTAQAKQQCMRSCRAEPFYFRSWESSVSWVVCNLATDPVGTCGNGTGDAWPGFLPKFGELEAAMRNHSEVLSGGTDDLWHGHQFCFFATLGQTIPYMFLALGVVLGATQLVKLPFALIAAAVQFLWQAVAYTFTE